MSLNPTHWSFIHTTSPIFIFYTQMQLKFIFKNTKFKSRSTSDPLEGTQDLTPSVLEKPLTSWIPLSFQACTAQCVACRVAVFTWSKS